MGQRSATARMKTFDVVTPEESTPLDAQAEVLRLFTEHGTALYRFCRSVIDSHGDAEDVVQDTFLKLLRHLREGGDRSNLKSWLFTVAANACRSRLRWQTRWLPWQADRHDRAIDPPDERPDLAGARRAMRGLPARDRLLISL